MQFAHTGKCFYKYLCKMVSEDGKEIFDPLRKKWVRLTPEERVRQDWIGALAGRFGVPPTHMMSEVALKCGDKSMRADIVIYGRDLRPRCVIECKEPSVKLGRQVLDQALRYNMLLRVPFICITNGTGTVVCGKDSDGRYRLLEHFPDYGEMTAAEF